MGGKQIYVYTYILGGKHIYTCMYWKIVPQFSTVLVYMGWLQLAAPLKLYVSFAKEPYKSDDILQKRRIILRSPLTVATP